jgi:hypothetical protein
MNDDIVRIAAVLHANGVCDAMFAHYGPAKKCERVARALVEASTCACGHAQIDHIYEEGACRPGFVCEAGCTLYWPGQPSGGDQP